MGQITHKLTMYEPAVYRICVQGELDLHWSDYFSAHAVSVETDDAGNTVTAFTSEPMDQGALVGLLIRLNAFGIPIVSIVAVSHANT